VVQSALIFAVIPEMVLVNILRWPFPFAIRGCICCVLIGANLGFIGCGEPVNQPSSKNESRSAFETMTDAEHLQSARNLLRGGDAAMLEGEKHLSAIKNTSVVAKEAEELSKLYAEARETQRREAAKVRAKQQEQLNALKSHFVVTKDEFNDTVTLRHRVFSKYMNGNGTTIAAKIVNHQLFLQSQFVSDDWIFHEEVTVKVGSSQLTAGGRTQHEVVSGIVETVSFDPADSVAIGNLIASSGSEPVRVRLLGKFYKDYTLRPTHQKAIQETVQYLTLLSQ
jgi:hypothetical protein